MTINLIVFTSSRQERAAIRHSHESLLAEIEKYGNIRYLFPNELSMLTPDDFCILFIATGGVESQVMQYFEQLPRPMVLLADGMLNSLAAAMEISASLHEKGMKSEILHGEFKEIIKRIFTIHHNFQARRQMAGARIGVIGTPAEWLISSSVDYFLAKRRWGIECVDIGLEHLTEYYRQVSDDEVGDECAGLAGNALACREGNPEEILKAMRLYHAIKRIVQEERLDAVTLSCFRLADKLSVTGCLAMALLNDNGITAGCEGDLQTVFTMYVARLLTQKASFMANPAFINHGKREIVLSHCTVGLKQCDHFIIRNHFETEKGISIQGILPYGDITLMRCGGKCLDDYYLTTGMLTENCNYLNLCRTQVRLKLDTPTDYFLKNPIGNHHVVIQGNYQTILDDFLQSYGCRKIE